MKEQKGAPCPECGVRHDLHHPLCSLQSEEQVRRQLATYFKTVLGAMERKRRADVWAAFWHGKWAILKLENNTLRRKLYSRERERGGPRKEEPSTGEE